MSKICSPGKLSHNMLRPYFESYKLFLNKSSPYFRRPHSFPLPSTARVYAESDIIYQLVHMKNIISVNNKLIMQKIIEKTHALTDFSKYVRNIMFEKYEYECTKRIMSYVWSVMSTIFMNVPTQIICCMRCSSISCDSMYELEYMKSNQKSLFTRKNKFIVYIRSKCSKVFTYTQTQLL